VGLGVVGLGVGGFRRGRGFRRVIFFSVKFKILD
jgi:hypothetical protein